MVIFIWEASAVARARGFDKAHALTKMEDCKQETETRTVVVAKRLVARCLILACNRPLDFERTREGPVIENSGEMSLHQRHMP